MAEDFIKLGFLAPGELLLPARLVRSYVHSTTCSVCPLASSHLVDSWVYFITPKGRGLCEQATWEVGWSPSRFLS
eukprot:scaffold63125_cov21-Tisochrysis_lutea.AAC.1